MRRFIIEQFLSAIILRALLDAQMQSGRYGPVSDVVRAGLRLPEEHEAKVRALQAALIAGQDSGEPALFDEEAFFKRMRTKHVA